MATNSDGSIVLSVQINTNSLKTELRKLKSAISSNVSELGKVKNSTKQAENAFQSLSGFIKIQENRLKALKEQYSSYILQGEKSSEKAKKLSEDIKKLSTSLEENKNKLDKAKNGANKFDKSISTLKTGIKGALKSLSSLALKLGVIFGIRELLRFSNESSKLASQMESNILRIGQIYGEASKKVYDFVDANAQALGMSKTAAYEAASSYGNLFSSFADGTENARLTNEMLQTTAVIASKTGRTFDEVFQKIQSGIFGNTRAIDDLGVYVNQATITTTQAFQTIADGRPWAQLTGNEQKQVLTLAILEQAQVKYGNTVLQTTALTRSQFNAAFQDFKATWGQVVNLILMPILEIATRILNTITAVLQRIFNLTGKQYSASSKVASSIGSASKNQNALSDNVKETNKGLKETNKELKKELASFDELEILSRDTAKNAGSSGSGAGGGIGGGDVGGGGGLLDSNEPIISQQEIDSKLAAIAAIAGAALVGLGILVMFSGHPWLGLGMVITGASAGLWAIAVLQDFATEDVITKLETLFTIIGVVAFNLGVLLLFTGNWKYGLGLMSMGVSAVATALGLGNFGGDIKKKVGEILVISGVVAFMLGVILLFIPNCWTYGLKLMASGASSVTMGILLGGEELKQELESFCTKYWQILYGIGIIMVVVGIVLLFVNAAGLWRYALSLILIGITDLVLTTVLGGDSLKQALEEFCAKHWKALYAVGIIMVCVGIVLLFTEIPHAMGIALTLIGVGIGEIVLTTELGGDALKTELETFCDKYWKEIYAISLLMVIIGIALCFTPAVGFGVALIVSGISAGVTATALSWETITSEFKKMAEGVETWIKKYNLLLCILGIILLFVPGMLSVGIGLLAVSGKSLGEEKDLSFSSLKEKLTTQLTGVYDAVKDKVDKIKNKINEVFDGGKGNIKTKVSGGGSRGGTRTNSARSASYKVPALARGAVIPANREFLAVLGDQKIGKNIEAPAELIKQMAMEAISESNLNNQGQTVREEHYYLDQTELMSILYKLVKGGERITGDSLID